MILGESAFVGDTVLSEVRAWGLEALGSDPGALRAGFIDLVEQAIRLEGK